MHRVGSDIINHGLIKPQLAATSKQERFVDLLGFQSKTCSWLLAAGYTNCNLQIGLNHEPIRSFTS